MQPGRSPLPQRSAGSAGSSPDLSASARSSSICRPPVAEAPTQSWIQRVRMLAHAPGSASQQLWPPPTFSTIVDCDGLSRFTTDDGLLIGGVHVVGTRELRRLAAGVVAVAAAIRAAHVLPEIDAERLDVGRGRCRPRVARACIRAAGHRVLGRRRAAAATGERNDAEHAQCGESSAASRQRG